MSPLFKPFEDRDEDYVALVLKHGRFAAYDLPRPANRQFFDGERMRRAYG
jgi:hypothetical protein